MPVLVTASQLRAVLGVSVSLYSDANLDDIINTAEDAIGDFLTQWKSNIIKHKHDDTTDITTLVTNVPHKFHEGQTIAISGVHAHVNGSKTILKIIDPYTFTVSSTMEATHDWWNNIPAGLAAANDLSQYDGVDSIEEAVLQIAIDVFQSRLAAGGTQQALDYTPAPYRMGRTLLYKVTGLISKYIDSNSQVG
jgi:hypothetical protein